ncbi:50S ribosomal protein L4 [Candidatus Kaiserbacteria bacterium]|nr:50S ribosomal protein L4 [Candidatus Kaiserbacteria bacterium]
MATTTNDTKKTTKTAFAGEGTVYNTQGKKAGTIKLPENIFGVAWNDALIHQVVTAMQANARTPVAHTKTRGDVAGGGKKPWRQKGTGRSRHGSSRSPIWKGGGVTHGPRNDKNYSQTIPKKMRAKALMIALSRKLADGQLIFVDKLAFDAPKTAVAKKTLVNLGSVSGFEKLGMKGARKNLALVAMPDPSAAATKSFANIACVTSEAIRNLNPVDVLQHKFVIIENPEAAIAVLATRGVKKTAVKKA